MAGAKWAKLGVTMVTKSMRLSAGQIAFLLQHLFKIQIGAVSRKKQHFAGKLSQYPD